MNLRILIIACVFYCLFSFDFILEPSNYKLFGNDFSKPYVLDWFYYEIKVHFYILCIGILGLIPNKNKFVERVIVAICMDAVITLLQTIIFGYFAPDFIKPIINAFPFSYIIYAYFVYGRC